MVHHSTFPADDDLSSPRTKVVQFERDNFSTAQSESSKQKQNRVISAPSERKSRYRQHLFHFAG
jgi:hypothetical protein